MFESMINNPATEENANHKIEVFFVKNSSWIFLFLYLWAIYASQILPFREYKRLTQTSPHTLINHLWYIELICFVSNTSWILAEANRQIVFTFEHTLDVLSRTTWPEGSPPIGYSELPGHSIGQLLLDNAAGNGWSCSIFAIYKYSALLIPAPQ